MSLGELMEAIRKAMTIGPHACMIEQEEAKGHTCVYPSDVDWLPASDWPADIVISISRKTVRIVAIYALSPNNGAFGRMITGIAQAGLKPVVICPSEEMYEICMRWGWRHISKGSTFEDNEDELFPSKKWLKHRANPAPLGCGGDEV